MSKIIIEILINAMSALAVSLIMIELSSNIKRICKSFINRRVME